jgi:hypothetical protein
VSEFNAKIGKQYKKPTENVSWAKFRAGMVDIISPVKWLKEIHSIINLRKIIIYAIIIASIFAYAYNKGHSNRPVKIDIGYGKEVVIELIKDSQLHIYKDGSVWLEDKEGNKLKQIGVKDIKGLKEKLSPIGFQLQPIAVVGYGLSDYGDSGVEAGSGISFFRFWQGNLEAFLTNKGIYGGASYSLTQLGMDNSAIGIGVGKGWEGDNRGILYFRMKF